MDQGESKTLVAKDTGTSNDLEHVWRQIEELLNDITKSSKEIAAKISDLADRLADILINVSIHEKEDACSFCQKNNPFNKLYHWTGQHRDCLRLLASKQLQYFFALISKADVDILCCKEVHVPLLLLLLSLKPTEKRKVPPDIELLYCQILHQISLRVKSSSFLEKLAQDIYTHEGFLIQKFTFFEILVNYIHRTTHIGDLARDGILSCIATARNHEGFEKFITQSSLCVIIAGGLSARYSSLPTALDIHVEDWYRITEQDLENMKELKVFIKTLEFCCAVVDSCNRTMQKQMMELIYNGFLLSVLVPALNQSSLEAQVAVMAYLELFIRSITSERILEIFLRVLVIEAYDNKPLIDLLICHINSESIQLCMVTIQLFKTLLELNCEDIIFSLIFRYLLPCDHVLPNQKRTIKEMDFFCKSATMFLYLTPSCCLELYKTNVESEDSPSLTRANISSSSLSSASSKQDGNISNHSPMGSRRSNNSPAISCSSISTHSDNTVNPRKSSTSSSKSKQSTSSLPSELTFQQAVEFMAYLCDAKETIGACKRACKNWSAVYDGMDFVSNNPRSRMYQLLSKRGSTNDGSFTYLRSASNVSTTSVDAEVIASLHDVKHSDGLISSECLGPFLNAVFDKLENMIDNTLYVNMLLTHLVTRLACYPQALLRSFLLNSNLVVRPGVRSLSQVITRVSLEVDEFLMELDDYKTLIGKARQNLIRRESRRYRRSSQELYSSPKLSEREERVAIDPNSGASRFQKNENREENGFVYSLEDIISLKPNTLISSFSVNTSQKSNDKDSKASVLLSHTPGKLHPAISRHFSKHGRGKRKAFSRADLIDMRLKNPTAIKNVVYCAVVLEEFMKELAAISIEQTLA